MSDLMYYPKVRSAYMRDPESKELTRSFSTQEFRLLDGLEWVWREKIDGTNTVVRWDGHDVSYHGRTPRTQMSEPLVRALDGFFGGDAGEQLMEQTFFSTDVTLYGEGCGGSIQRSTEGRYFDTESFVLFDVLINGVWLQSLDVDEVAGELGVRTAPLLRVGGDGKLLESSISELRSVMQWRVHEDRIPRTALNPMSGPRVEGYVGVAPLGLLDRMGNRLQVKLKYSDLVKRGE